MYLHLISLFCSGCFRNLDIMEFIEVLIRLLSEPIFSVFLNSNRGVVLVFAKKNFCFAVFLQLFSCISSGGVFRLGGSVKARFLPTVQIIG